MVWLCWSWWWLGSCVEDPVIKTPLLINTKTFVQSQTHELHRVCCFSFFFMVVIGPSHWGTFWKKMEWMTWKYIYIGWRVYIETFQHIVSFITSKQSSMHTQGHHIWHSNQIHTCLHPLFNFVCANWTWTMRMIWHPNCLCKCHRFSVWLIFGVRCLPIVNPFHWPGQFILETIFNRQIGISIYSQ